MQLLGRLSPVAWGVGALGPGEVYRIRHSSRMGLRRPLVGHLWRLGTGCLWLTGLKGVGGRRVLCCRMRAARWVVGLWWFRQDPVV